MAHLIKVGVVFNIEQYYLLQYEEKFIKRRKEGNIKAKAVFPRAQKNAKFISQFPFVKGVFVSGSLSKGFLDEEGDIDYFIITEPNRLWVSRMCLILYKKVFLFNSRKYFCVNYFIDENSLEITDKNLFTATEVFTIKPMVNKELYQKFRNVNNWTLQFYPFKNSFHTNEVLKLKKSYFAKFLEWIMKGRVGEFLDKTFMRITLKRWNKKFHMYSPEEFELLFRSERRVSKHHPSNYQKKVMEAYETNLNEARVKLHEQSII